MLDWQQRVIEEKQQLDERRTALLKFMQSDEYIKLPQAERDLFLYQKHHMTGYSLVLGARIAEFK